MAYAALVGVTTHLDQGAWPSTASCGAGCGCGSDLPPDCGQAPDDGAAHADEYGLHLPLVTLHHEGRMTIRIRVNFLLFETDPSLPHLRARLANTWPFFGSEYLANGGIGEFSAQGVVTLPHPVWLEATTLIARNRWRNENHSIVAPDYQAIVDGWEAVNRVAPIGDLRWVLAHVPSITPDYLERLKVLGCGVNLSGFTYFSNGAGPPYRTILASGIRAAAGGDGMQIAPMNPFIHIYHATTGRNARGVIGNPGEQISRLDALRLWTSATPWFFDDEATGHDRGRQPRRPDRAQPRLLHRARRGSEGAAVGAHRRRRERRARRGRRFVAGGVSRRRRGEVGRRPPAARSRARSGRGARSWPATAP